MIFWIVCKKRLQMGSEYSAYVLNVFEFLTLAFTMGFTLQWLTLATSLSKSVPVGFDQSGRNCMHSRWFLFRGILRPGHLESCPCAAISQRKGVEMGFSDELKKLGSLGSMGDDTAQFCGDDSINHDWLVLNDEPMSKQVVIFPTKLTSKWASAGGVWALAR